MRCWKLSSCCVTLVKCLRRSSTALLKQRFSTQWKKWRQTLSPAAARETPGVKWRQKTVLQFIADFGKTDIFGSIESITVWTGVQHRLYASSFFCSMGKVHLTNHFGNASQNCKKCFAIRTLWLWFPMLCYVLETSINTDSKMQLKNAMHFLKMDSFEKFGKSACFPLNSIFKLQIWHKNTQTACSHENVRTGR